MEATDRELSFVGGRHGAVPHSFKTLCMPRWSATDRKKRRDVAGHRGSGESANKFYSEGAHLSSCWEIPQARTAARVKLPLGVNRIILVGGRLLPVFLRKHCWRR
jgi:hypothetical protein